MKKLLLLLLSCLYISISFSQGNGGDKPTTPVLAYGVSNSPFDSMFIMSDRYQGIIGMPHWLSLQEMRNILGSGSTIVDGNGIYSGSGRLSETNTIVNGFNNLKLNNLTFDSINVYEVNAERINLNGGLFFGSSGNSFKMTGSDGLNGQVLGYDVVGDSTKWIDVGAGGGGNLNNACEEKIFKVAHGFSVGSVVFLDKNGDWLESQANTDSTTHDAIIISVPHVDTFNIQFCGLANITGQTYTVGVDYYTSETTAGDLRNTVPTKGYVDFIGVGRGGTKIQLKDVNAVYTGIAVPTGAFLLDISLSPANAAYSLRKLSNSYTGNVITIRRASDDLTTNIGFDVNGDLDQSALTTFCASTDCHVTTWYDQSGSSLNAAQTTNTKQPKIVTNGVVEIENSKPTIVFDGVDDELEVGTVSTFNYLHNGTSSSVINVSKYDDVTNEALLGNNRGANSEVGFAIFYYNTNRVSTYCTNGSSQVLFNQSASTTDILSQHLLFTTVDADNLTASNRSIMSINDEADFSNNTTSNSPTANDASYVTTIGNSGKTASNFFEGNIQELVIFSTDQSPLKSSFLTNINNYYAIY